MSKLLKNFIGIDISKSYFDVALIVLMHPGQHIHHQFSQCKNGFKEMLQWLAKQGVIINEETIFCMEYTGIYNTGLVNFLVGQKALV